MFRRRYALYSGLVFVGVLLVLLSPLLHIKKITIAGTKLVSGDEIVALGHQQEARHRWLIFSQSSLLFFDANTFRQTIREQSPRIADVLVKRHFPPSLSVQITEHEASGVWQNQNRFFEISNGGNILGEVVQPQAGEPVIVDSNRVVDTRPGETVITPELLQQINVITEGLRNFQPVKIQNFDIAKADEFTISARITTGWDIFFSTHLDIPQQIQKLKVFVDQKEQENFQWQAGLHYVDLRFTTTRVYYQ